MIFVTVGTQLPFDRLVSAVDTWARRTRQRDVFAQIGPSKLRPSFIDCCEFLPPTEFARYFAAADLIVAHAGMGSIITAMTNGKPLLVMPRSAKLNEHRNDHQLGTAMRFKALRSITVAMDTDELVAELDRFRTIPPASRVEVHASSTLLDALRDFLSSDRRK